LVTGAKLVVLALVGWAIASRISLHYNELRQQDWDWNRIRPGWLLLSGALYALGLAPCAWCWGRVMRQLGGQASWFDTFRAHYIGHLGKYVPGKALVLILRVWFLRGRVPATLAGLTAFYETLTMMAVGGLTAGVILAVIARHQLALLALAVGFAILAGLPLWPPLFHVLARRLGIGRAAPDLLDKLAGLQARALLPGAVGVAGGWFLMGLSLAAVLIGLGDDDPAVLAHWPLLTAAVALSVVAGFASLLPGGIGVREWVLMELLTPALGDDRLAILAPLVLRVIWFAVEVVLAGVFYLLGPRPVPVEVPRASAVEVPAVKVEP